VPRAAGAAPAVRAASRAAFAVLTGRRRVYYGWWLLAGSVVAMALGSGVSMWAFGLYVEPLERQFGWTRAEVSLAFSLSLLTSGLFGPLIGRWIDARGPRSAILVGTVLTSLTYLLMATTQSLWQWYVYNAVNAIVRQLMFFFPFMALISRWFDRRRGIAISVLGSGFSLGGFAVVPVVGVVVGAVGWRGALVFTALAIAAVFLPLGAWLIRNRPSDIGVFVDGLPPEPLIDGRSRAEHGMTLGAAMRTSQFWVISFALMLFFYGMIGWLVHQIPFYESVGISRGAATAIVSVSSGLGIVARLALGVVSDRIDRFEGAAMVLAALLAGAMAMLWLNSSMIGIAVFVTLWIAGSSGGPMMEALLLTRSFGVAHFGTILGAIAAVETVGQILSPTIAGAIYDATGGYDWALVMFVGTFTASLVLFAVARRMPLPVAA